MTRPLFEIVRETDNCRGRKMRSLMLLTALLMMGLVATAAEPAPATSPTPAVEKQTLSIKSSALKDMERIREELGSGFCRMCNYCQPCPQQILISAIMYTPVALTRFDPERIFKGEWDKFMQKIPDCIDCGDCEKRCPYELPIRERIREAGKQYYAAREAYMAGH